jgi:hypothetical protein
MMVQPFGKYVPELSNLNRVQRHDGIKAKDTLAVFDRSRRACPDDVHASGEFAEAPDCGIALLCLVAGVEIKVKDHEGDEAGIGIRREYPIGQASGIVSIPAPRVGTPTSVDNVSQRLELVHCFGFAGHPQKWLKRLNVRPHVYIVAVLITRDFMTGFYFVQTVDAQGFIAFRQTLRLSAPDVEIGLPDKRIPVFAE